MKNIFYFGILLIVLSSCKVNYTFSGATIPPEAKTVSIAYFPNYASLANPTLSQSFTEALKDVFVSQTKLNLVDQNGDLSFEGSITGYSVAPASIQSNDQAASNRLTITVNVKFINTPDTTKNFETSFSRFADYESSQNFSAAESDLIKTINKQLVDDIFNKALNNW